MVGNFLNMTKKYKPTDSRSCVNDEQDKFKEIYKRHINMKFLKTKKVLKTTEREK